MRSGEGGLRVPEAQRRCAQFIVGINMRSLPVLRSVLDMPSLAVCTPHYAEPVLYARRGFLHAVNAHGVTPLVYLKALHGAEFGNLLERLGVADEAAAWAARTDGFGAPVSGDLEVRVGWGAYE